MSDAAPLTARGGPDEVEIVHDVRDAALAEQAHPDDEPHHVLRRQLTPAYRCLALSRQRVGDRGSIAALNCSKVAGCSAAPDPSMASPNSIDPGRPAPGHASPLAIGAA